LKANGCRFNEPLLDGVSLSRHLLNTIERIDDRQRLQWVGSAKTAEPMEMTLRGLTHGAQAHLRHLANTFDHLEVRAQTDQQRLHATVPILLFAADAFECHYFLRIKHPLRCGFSSKLFVHLFCVPFSALTLMMEEKSQ